MTTWLKTIGTGDKKVEDDWYDDRGGFEWFSCPRKGHPSIEAGDRVLIYASGHRKIIAAVEVTDEPEWNPDLVTAGGTDGYRWPWLVRCKPLLVVPRTDDAPPLGRARVNSLSVRSQSHIELDATQYRAGVAGLAEAAALDGEHYGALMD